MTAPRGPYFHGGCPWLRPGELVLPPARSGARSMYDDLTDEELSDLAADGVDLRTMQAIRRRDVIYVTTEPLDAELFARLYPHTTGGAVYEVEPAEPLEEDPDYRALPVTSFTAPEARVRRILRTSLRPTPELRQIVRAGGYR